MSTSRAPTVVQIPRKSKAPISALINLPDSNSPITQPINLIPICLAGISEPHKPRPEFYVTWKGSW